MPEDTPPLQPQPTEPVVVYSYNDSNLAKGPRHIHWGVLIGAGAVLFLLVAAALYFWLLPTIWSSAYTKNTQPLYARQVMQMNNVYQSLNRQIFITANESVEQNAQDLRFIAAAIATATQSTNALKAKDTLIVLPGSTWQAKVTAASKQHQAMQQYVADSQAFLRGYQTLIVYTQQVQQLASAKLPAIISDTSAINKGTGSLDTFTSELQTTTTDMQAFLTQLKTLTPPTDLQSFNQNLLTSLNDMNGALSAQQSDIQSSNVDDFRSQLAVYVSAYNNFVDVLESNPTATIATDSSLSNQVKTLRTEQP